MVAILILYITLVSLIFSVVLQFLVTNSWWQTVIIVACFWILIFYLMDFIVLVFLRAREGKSYDRFRLGNMNILAGFKKSKIYISDILPRQIIIVEGAIGQKIIVLGEQLSALLSQDEIKSLTVFYFSLVNQRGFKARTYLTSIVILFYWFSRFSKITKNIFNFYFFQMFQVIQVFPVNEKDLHSCEKLVESFFKTKTHLESAKRKVFSKNNTAVSLAEKIVFPISTNGNFHQLIIDTIRINLDESLAE